MTSVIMQEINPDEVYNKLVDINGLNSFGLTMTYFNYLYSFKEFWSNRHPYGLSPKSFTNYVEFARYEVPWGLGWDIDVIKACCKRNPNIWKQYEEQINPLPKHGGIRYRDDISFCLKEQGTSRQYQIQRLKRDAPDIASCISVCAMFILCVCENIFGSATGIISTLSSKSACLIVLCPPTTSYGYSGGKYNLNTFANNLNSSFIEA